MMLEQEFQNPSHITKTEVSYCSVHFVSFNRLRLLISPMLELNTPIQLQNGVLVLGLTFEVHSCPQESRQRQKKEIEYIGSDISRKSLKRKT